MFTLARGLLCVFSLYEFERNLYKIDKRPGNTIHNLKDYHTIK